MKWYELEFRDFIKLQRGFDLPKSKMKDGEIPVLGSNSIIGFHNEPKVNPPGVITGRSGTLGVVQYIDKPYWPHNTALWVKDFKENDPRFVFYKLKTLNLDSFSSGASVPTLNRNNLDNLVVSIPGIEQQRRIASILSAYDDLIENNQRRIKFLEESARQLYKEWFVRLRFPGYEHTRIIDGVPEGWERKTAYDIMNIQSGGTPSTKVQDYWDGEIPFYTPKDYTNYPYVINTERYITEVGLSNCNSKLYPKSTIFISARGTVGKIIMAQKPMAMSQTSYALTGKNGVSQLFLYCALQSSLQEYKQRAIGAVFDAIVVDTFKLILFILPNKRLVEHFEDLITPIFKQIENLLLTNLKLRQARDILLPKLMSGEVEV
jgi:type I restriction enzyme, S subunit